MTHRPGALARQAEPIVLDFSEPLMELPGVDFWVRGDSTEAPDGTWAWKSRVQAVFTPDVAWAVGSHRLRGNLHQLRDGAHLAPADSSAAVEFEVVGAGDMAAIGGQVTGGVGHPIWIEVRGPGAGVGDSGADGSARSEPRLAQAGPDGAFLVEGVLPGPVQVGAFEDRNRNGKRDAGERHPYEAAEASARLTPDPEPGRGERILDLTMELR